MVSKNRSRTMCNKITGLKHSMPDGIWNLIYIYDILVMGIAKYICDLLTSVFISLQDYPWILSERLMYKTSINMDDNPFFIGICNWIHFIGLCTKLKPYHSAYLYCIKSVLYQGQYITCIFTFVLRANKRVTKQIFKPRELLLLIGMSVNERDERKQLRTPQLYRSVICQCLDISQISRQEIKLRTWWWQTSM